MCFLLSIRGEEASGELRRRDGRHAGDAELRREARDHGRRGGHPHRLREHSHGTSR